MLSELKELWRFRELLFTMVQRDLKIRYKNSALGFFWSLLNPLLTVLVMTFVFQNFMGVKVPNYSAYLLSAYLPFIFFQNCLMDSAQTILVAMPLIKKIYFPRELLPLAAVISNFINFMLSMVVFFGYMLAVYLFFPGDGGHRVWPFQWGTLFLPVLFLVSFCLATGFSFIVSAFNTFYEDVKYILGVVLYLLFFLCPIVYFSELVGNSELNDKTGGLVYKLYHLNPVAELSVAYRKLMLAPVDVPTGIDPVSGKTLLIPALPIDWRYVVLAGIVSFAFLLLGYSTFNRLKWRFVERP
ncbi:MAG TPA: ABC transporter permease [Fimbriimonas sp.]|nr:ABC transporter permease [Fimbriimonas sp.]